MYGIDISEHNGNIDLTKYKDQFVIIRAGWGQGHPDKKFARNVTECEKLGIPYGLYWYSYALCAADAKKEAKFFKDHIKGLSPSMGVWLDMEDADGWKKKNGWTPNKQRVSAVINAFCQILQDAGFYTGVYMSYSWRSYCNDAAAKWPLWVAHWGANDGKRHGDHSGIAVLHQYTSKPLDKDYSYIGIIKGKTTPVKDVDEIVKDVLLGKYGNGAARQKALGVNYKPVQNRINKLLPLVRRTLNGYYGNGSARKKALGANYDMVQWIINNKVYN